MPREKQPHLAPHLGRALVEIVKGSDDWVSFATVIRCSLHLLDDSDAITFYQREAQAYPEKYPLDRDEQQQAEHGRKLLVLGRLSYHVETGDLKKRGRGVETEYKTATPSDQMPLWREGTEDALFALVPADGSWIDLACLASISRELISDEQAGAHYLRLSETHPRSFPKDAHFKVRFAKGRLKAVAKILSDLRKKRLLEAEGRSNGEFQRWRRTTPTEAAADGTAEPTTITIGQRVFRVLFPDVLRPLTQVERLKLKTLIIEFGVITPLVVDERDGVIDGGHRLTIAAELGLDEIPVEVRRGLTLEQKATLAISLNEARRHLTPADLKQLQADRPKRIARVVEARKRGDSLRAIAEQEQVSKAQVEKDLETATVHGGQSVQPADGKVKGKDGKERPAKRKGAAGPKKAASSAGSTDGLRIFPAPEPDASGAAPEPAIAASLDAASIEPDLEPDHAEQRQLEHEQAAQDVATDDAVGERHAAPIIPVTIDSGPVEAEHYLHEVSPERWANLVLARRTFLSWRLNHDCRCIVQFVRDAEQMWRALGYASAADLIREGYDLEPEEIRLAVRWLELNEPGSAVGLEAMLQAELGGEDARDATQASVVHRLLEQVEPHLAELILMGKAPQAALAPGEVAKVAVRIRRVFEGLIQD